MTHGEVLIHQDGQDQWLVTWVPDNDNTMDYPGFTISPASDDFPELFGSAHDPEALVNWAREQPWAMRNIGPWSAPVQINAMPAFLVEADELNLALLGIILTAALSLGLAFGTWVGTARGPVWGFVAGLLIFVGASVALILLVHWPRTNRHITAWARKLTPRP